MVDFARRDPELDRHESLLMEMHRADADSPEVTTDRTTSGLKMMDEALDLMRAQRQLLHNLQLAPAAQYKKEQLLAGTEEVERSARNATLAVKHAEGLLVAQTAHKLADEMRSLTLGA